MFPNIDSSSRGSKKQNPSGIKLVLEFITVAISIKTDYDSHLLIKQTFGRLYEACTTPIWDETVEALLDRDDGI